MILLINKLREIYSNDIFIICDIIAKVIAVILVLFIIRRVLKLRKFYSKSLHDKYYNSYDNNCECCDDCEYCDDCEDCEYCNDCDDCEDYSEEVYEDEEDYEDGDLEEDYEDGDLEEDYEDGDLEEDYDEVRELSPNEKRKQTMIKKYGVPYAFMLKRK